MTRSTIILMPLTFHLADVSQPWPLSNHSTIGYQLQNSSTELCKHQISFDLTIFSSHPKKEFICEDGSIIVQYTTGDLLMIFFMSVALILAAVLIITFAYKYKIKKLQNRTLLAYHPKQSDYVTPLEPSYIRGLCDTKHRDFKDAERFCFHNPVLTHYNFSPRQLDLIRNHGACAWKFSPTTHIRVEHVSDGTQILTFSLKSTHSETTFTNMPLLQPIHSSFYFEMQLLAPAKPNVTVGLACLPYPTFRMPGSHRRSIGLCTFSGRKYKNDSFGGSHFSKPFQKGDIVGIGFDSVDGGVYFTKNGEKIGKEKYAFTNVFGNVTGVYPAIGSKGGAKLAVNFGSKAFLYGAVGGFQLS